MSISIKAEIILDTHIMTHEIRSENDVPKDKWVGMVGQITSQWCAVGVLDYDADNHTATHYAPSRIKEIKIKIEEHLITVPGPKGIAEGKLVGV